MLGSSKSLIRALLATGGVVTLALAWFGFRLVQQESDIERQRRRDQLESAADSAAAAVRGRLAEIGERLNSWLSTNEGSLPEIPGAVTIALNDRRPRSNPPNSLPFFPSASESPAADSKFSAIEAREFANHNLAPAAEEYRKLSSSGDPAIRAGALLRLARVLRKLNDPRSALSAYKRLESLGPADAAGLPSEIAGLDGQRHVLAALGDAGGSRQAAARLAQVIDSGIHVLSRGQAEFYRDFAPEVPKPDSWLLADALESAWNEAMRTSSPRGMRLTSARHITILVLWRANPQKTIALVGAASTLLPLPPSPGWLITLSSQRLEQPTSRASRIIGDDGGQFILSLRPASPSPSPPGVVNSRLVLAMLAAVIAFLWGAVYFMARAVRREAEVSKLQSDFVAAVSHEFRSPLTTVRQLSEMLEMGQVPSEERRARYYHVLTFEARRLQRLVETLLNFGRMEAGAERYRLEPVELSELAARVATEIENNPDSPHRIHTAPSSPPIRVLADADALSLALRNLLDNALKYSPPGSPVTLQWQAENGCASISVADEGPGIPAEEREAIFQKFVRGQNALQASVKGTGVGLAMVRHIMSALGGEVRLESEPGQGSTFTLSLPLSE